MIRHIFLDKCNTIIKDSNLNTGLNPIVELNAGKTLSRILLHFDIDEIKKSIVSGDYQTQNLKYTLKMFNCGSVNLPIFNDKIENGIETKYRASSFDIIAFRLPYEWDRGRGFDYNADYFIGSNSVTSKDGSNWFFSKTGFKWDEPGIYSYEALLNDESLIINKQHFDSGTEDLELDITTYVNGIINEEYPNNGIGLMFSPEYEIGEGYEALPYKPSNVEDGDILEVDVIPNEKVEGVLFLLYNEVYYTWTRIRSKDSFISFFGPETNTFFNPYVEVVNSEIILDNRNNFHLGVTNRLYFFTSDNGEYFNLDEVPTCTINDVQYPVKHSGKGVYYAEIKINKNEMEADAILYDTWSNIVLNGEIMDDVEMEFVVLPMESRIMLGGASLSTYNLVPSTYGINDNEHIKIGDIREIRVDFIEEYSSYGLKHLPTKSEYRIYVKEGDREITVFPYQPLERFNTEHVILINTNDLIPNKYYIDIKVNQGRSIKNYEKVIEFYVVNDVTKYSI